MNTASAKHDRKFYPSMPKLNLFYILNEWVYPLAFGAVAGLAMVYVVVSSLSRMA